MSVQAWFIIWVPLCNEHFEHCPIATSHVSFLHLSLKQKDLDNKTRKWVWTKLVLNNRVASLPMLKYRIQPEHWSVNTRVVWSSRWPSRKTVSLRVPCSRYLVRVVANTAFDYLPLSHTFEDLKRYASYRMVFLELWLDVLTSSQYFLQVADKFFHNYWTLVCLWWVFRRTNTERSYSTKNKPDTVEHPGSIFRKHL